MKPRGNIALLATLLLAAWAGCTQGNSHYQPGVEGGSPHDGPAPTTDVGNVGPDGSAPADGVGPADARPVDATAPADGGPADTGAVDGVVPTDTAAPADTAPADSAAADTAPPVDTPAPADTALPVDTAPAPDAAVPDTADTAPPADTGPFGANGMRGVYYSGRDHNTQLMERVDQVINFNWGHESPDPRVPVDDFSVRWYGRLQPRYTERYTLSVVSDDGVRLMINGVYVIDKWTSQSSVENSYQVNLVAGQLYDIQLEYFDRQLTALIRFYWASPSQMKEIVPYSRLFIR